MDSFAWQCPFCSHNATITDSNYSSSRHVFNHGNRDGTQGVITEVTVCPNPDCKQFALTVRLRELISHPGAWVNGELKHKWQLVPSAAVKVFPDYVPAPILTDYREAALIRGASPKAAATLARRCLQGMIRDYWGMRKARLVDEIEAIKSQVDPLTWAAIDAVRQIGNIGAHMEKDINTIIDVDPDEASLLIGLIETLIHDWYVVRHEREERLKKIVEASDTKKAERGAAKTSPSLPSGSN